MLCCAVGIQSPFPWPAAAHHPPPWLHSSCAVRGGFVVGVGQDAPWEEPMSLRSLSSTVPESQIWVKKGYICFQNHQSSCARLLKHLRVKHGFV